MDLPKYFRTSFKINNTSHCPHLKFIFTSPHISRIFIVKNRKLSTLNITKLRKKNICIVNTNTGYYWTTVKLIYKMASILTSENCVIKLSTMLKIKSDFATAISMKMKSNKSPILKIEIASN